MINAELIVRAHNQRSKEGIKNHIPKEAHRTEPIDFQCECSDIHCTERISLTLKQYEKLHDDNARFVVVKGHEEPKVEKIYKKNNDMAVVEKYAL